MSLKGVAGVAAIGLGSLLLACGSESGTSRDAGAGAAGGPGTGGVAGSAGQPTAGAGGGGATGGAGGGSGGLAGAGSGGAAAVGPFFCSGTIFRVADFDGDGTPDCVVTTPVGPPEPTYATYPVFLKGLGYGAYSRAGVVSPIVMFNDPAGLSTADLSGDGIADLAVVSEFAQIGVFNVVYLTYLKARGDGTFTTGAQTVFMSPVSAGWRSAGTGDFNGDGKPDVLVAGWSEGDTQDVYWLLVGDEGATQLDAGFKLGPQGSLSMGNVPGDLNGDKALDVAAALGDVNLGGATVSQDVIISYGAGDGTFAPPVHVPGTTGATSVSVGDLNGDGKLDLDVSYDVPSFTTVPMYGDGAGNFSTTPP